METPRRKVVAPRDGRLVFAPAADSAVNVRPGDAPTVGPMRLDLALDELTVVRMAITRLLKRELYEEAVLAELRVRERELERRVRELGGDPSQAT